MGDLVIDEFPQLCGVVLQRKTQLCHPPLVLHSVLLWHFCAAEKHNLLGVGVLFAFELEEAVQPAVAVGEAGFVVLVEAALEAVLLAEMVGVEGLYFEEGEGLAVVVEEAQHLRLLVVVVGGHVLQ